MTNRTFLPIILFVLCLVLVSSVSVFAEAGVNVHINACQHRHVGNIDDYLTQLNLGLVTPFNTTITTFHSTDQGVDEFSVSPYWLWTDCSNIFGHSWGDWSGWEEVGTRVHFPKGSCSARISRARLCTRTHCDAVQTEEDMVWVNCCN